MTIATAPATATATAARTTRARASVLVVDDDPHLLAALAELLRLEGYAVTTASSVEWAMDILRRDTFHLVLTDLQLPGRNGLSFIKALRETCPATKSVLVTGHGSIRSAVTALKRGAAEYVTKPVRPKRLLALCHALTADPPAFLPNRLLVEGRADSIEWGGMQARSTRMREVFEQAERASSVRTPLLLLGEEGSGRERLARAVHDRSSSTVAPFVVARTRTLPADPEGLGAALFGSGGLLEQADGGTLFLDELSALDALTQRGLLRFLETAQAGRLGGRRERILDVRLVATSSVDLPGRVSAGQLDAALYYRLAAATIAIPPLRERTDDIPVLAAELVRELAELHQCDVSTIPAETERLLVAYAWPGNVRELRNIIAQAVQLARSSTLEATLLPQMLHGSARRQETMRIAIGTRMETIEREVILRTLAANDGNKTATAEVLGISRRSIYNKLASYEDAGR